MPERLVDWAGIESRVRPPGVGQALWERYWNVLSSRLGTNSQQLLQALARWSVELAQPKKLGQPVPENRGVNFLTAMLAEIRESVRIARTTGGWRRVGLHDDGGEGGGQVHTVLVGSADYDAYSPGGVDLNEGLQDVDTWANYYTEVAQATDVKTLTDEASVLWKDEGLGPGTGPPDTHAGEQNLLAELSQMADNAQPGDVLVFHYSGHSIQEGIQLPDNRTDNGLHVVNWTKIYEAMADTKASKIVMTLDSCYSGGAVETFTRWEQGYDVIGNPKPATPVDPNKWIIVSATAATETAKVGVWGDGGLLTKQYVNRLEAEGGDVSMYEAFNGMAGTIRNRGRVQHPQWDGNDHNFSFKGADKFGEGKDDLPKNPGSFKPDTPKKGPVTRKSHTSVRPVDPNEKATFGVGANGYIRGDHAIAYTIFFENDPKVGATAPVQELLITDQLPSQLDWSTLELMAIRFGDQVATIPPDEASTTAPSASPATPTRCSWTPS